MQHNCNYKLYNMSKFNRIKRISDTDIWIGYKVYTCYAGVVECCAGGKAEEEDIKKATQYFKRNKML